MKTIPHRIFYQDGTYEDTTQEVPDDYGNPTPHTYNELEQTQQAITDLELATIGQGQSMTDLELMILEGNYV
jgi:uncharacterized damage-inducible protein DinB